MPQSPNRFNLPLAMSDLIARFEAARADSKNLPEKPDNMTLLKLYALYKQGSTGDVEGERPGDHRAGPRRVRHHEHELRHGNGG